MTGQGVTSEVIAACKGYRRPVNVGLRTLMCGNGHLEISECGDDGKPVHAGLVKTYVWRRLNKGPAGAALGFDVADQRATVAVGTALALACNEVVQGDYHEQCKGLAVASNSGSVVMRTVYRPRVDGSVSATSAFAIVGMEPGTAQVRVRTLDNEYTLTVNVVG